MKILKTIIIIINVSKSENNSFKIHLTKYSAYYYQYVGIFKNYCEITKYFINLNIVLDRITIIIYYENYK